MDSSRCCVGYSRRVGLCGGKICAIETRKYQVGRSMDVRLGWVTQIPRRYPASLELGAESKLVPTMGSNGGRLGKGWRATPSLL